MNILSPQEIGERYNLIADSFGKVRSLSWGLDYVRRFLSLLPVTEGKPNSSTILDIGCGTGIPLTRELVSAGAKVIGLDISTKMIEQAKNNVPGASFILGDILTTPLEAKFDGILAWDSLFHIPLRKQEQAIKKVVNLLKVNGVFLFTAGGGPGEVVGEMFGTEFYYSSLAGEIYENILKNHDCQVLINEIDDPSSHGHRVICCRKLAR